MEYSKYVEHIIQALFKNYSLAQLLTNKDDACEEAHEICLSRKGNLKLRVPYENNELNQRGFLKLKFSVKDIEEISFSFLRRSENPDLGILTVKLEVSIETNRGKAILLYGDGNNTRELYYLVWQLYVKEEEFGYTYLTEEEYQEKIK